MKGSYSTVPATVGPRFLSVCISSCIVLAILKSAAHLELVRHVVGTARRSVKNACVVGWHEIRRTTSNGKH